MAKRYTSFGLVIAFVLGGVIGVLAWDRFVAEDTSGAADPSSPPEVGRNADLLDLVRAVETLPAVAECSMAEMFGEGTPVVQAVCSTSGGDELRITYWNEPVSSDGIAATCDQFFGTGQLFVRDRARWHMALISQQGSTDPRLAEQLADLVDVQPMECSG